VRGNHQRRAAGFCALAQQAQRRFARHVVQTGRGLVGQDHTRRTQHGARQRHALRLPARELRGQAPRQFAHAQRVQRAGDRVMVHRQPRCVIDQRQVAGHAQRVAQVQLLRQQADSPRAPGIAGAPAERAQRLPGHDHFALGGRQQAGRQRQPGRFAAARGPAQQQRAALLDPHIGKAQPGSAGIAITQAKGFDHADDGATRRAAKGSAFRQP
jgi:hypothetical protein